MIGGIYMMQRIHNYDQKKLQSIIDNIKKRPDVAKLTKQMKRRENRLKVTETLWNFYEMGSDYE